jgi:hypothetical protein
MANRASVLWKVLVFDGSMNLRTLREGNPMSNRWIVLIAGACLLGATAWYFGRPESPKIEVQDPNYGLGPAAPTEAPKPVPPKVIEVIDLARAYEPSPEPEIPMPGGINPASFIEEPTAPARIPMAFRDAEHDFSNLLIRIRESPLGSFLMGVGLPKAERTQVKPREVIQSVPDFQFFSEEIVPREGANKFQSEDPIPVKLDVMPREVPFVRGPGID